MMTMSQLLDPIPVTFVFVGFVLVALATYEAGIRLGRWWKARSPDQEEGATGTIVGSILGLLAFLLAVTMSMASDRFDTRRGLVRDEANTINTTFLRAGYLAQPYGTNIQNLLRQYVPLRIASADATRVAANYVESEAIHGELWMQAQQLIRETPDSEVRSLFIDSLNQLIELHTTRLTARIYGRVPETIVVVLLVGAVLSLGMVGYSAGLTSRGSLFSAVMLIVVLGAVLTLVIDLDRPQEGFLQVNQQPLIDLRARLGTPPR